MRIGETARVWFTPKQRAGLWKRWKSGQCVADVACALERRNKSRVYRVLALNGGIAPAPRRRTERALRLEEREEIARGIAAGRTVNVIVAKSAQGNKYIKAVSDGEQPDNLSSGVPLTR